METPEIIVLLVPPVAPAEGKETVLLVPFRLDSERVEGFRLALLTLPIFWSSVRTYDCKIY